MAKPTSDRGIYVLPGRSPFSADIRAFLIDCQARGLAQTTVVFYRKKLAYLQRYMASKGITATPQVTPTLLRSFLADMRETHNPGGVSQIYRSAAVFFKWLLSEGIIADNPMAKLKSPKVAPQPLEPVSLEVVAAMVKTCGRDFNGQRDKAMILALLDSGCRASEFISLNVGDVDLPTGAVIVRRGKGGKFRTTFLGSKALREVIRYLRRRPDVSPDAPLWVSEDGRRLAYSGLRQVVRRRAEKAMVDVPSLHSFRRAFALLSLRGGMDVYSLQKLMGHADLSVLRRYLAQTEADLKEAHRKASPVDNWLR